jgi:hypothetical protein
MTPAATTRPRPRPEAPPTGSRSSACAEALRMQALPREPRPCRSRLWAGRGPTRVQGRGPRPPSAAAPVPQPEAERRRAQAGAPRAAARAWALESGRASRPEAIAATPPSRAAKRGDRRSRRSRRRGRRDGRTARRARLRRTALSRRSAPLRPRARHGARGACRGVSMTPCSRRR